jgi:hypothetical protein
MEETVEILLKKDDDATILEYDPFGGLLVETELTQVDGLILDQADPAPDDPPEFMDVFVRMVQVVFLVNAVLAFCAILLGIVPYFLLMLVPDKIALYATLGVGGLFAVAYLVMLIVQRQWIMIACGFVLTMFLGALAALLRDAAPLQLATAVFMQSMTVTLYVAFSRRGIEPWVAGVAMLVAGVATWAVGIYAFVEQQDWTAGAVVLVLIALFAIYSSLEIYFIDRFSLSDEHLTQAVVCFYGDPVYIFLRICHFSKRASPRSSA